MLLHQVSLALLALALATDASLIPQLYGLARRDPKDNGRGTMKPKTTTTPAPAPTPASPPSRVNNGGGAINAAANGETCLDPDLIQANSNKDGSDGGDDGQTASETDPANFINSCKGQTLTNGLQVKEGSCCGIAMGQIPSTANMISGIIISPKPMEDLEENQTFTVSIQTTGLAAGTFTNPKSTYYSAPQKVDGAGKVIGHTHVTIQDLGSSVSPSQPPDPATFVFFKGVNGRGDGKGLLSAEVTGGLPAGNYRLCSMTSSANHQPVLMPVAQRGAQDDCQKFTVGSGGGGDDQRDGGENRSVNPITANPNPVTVTATASSSSAPAPPPGQTPAEDSSEEGSPTGQDLGGAAPPVTASGDAARPFAVNGATFVNEGAAKQRACDIQNNACFNAVNGGRLPGVETADCAAQQTACSAAV